MTPEKLESQMADKYSGGSKDEELKDVVAFDTSCDKSKISIKSRKDTAGAGMYLISACGKDLKYKRTGTVFHSADKDPLKQ